MYSWPMACTYVCTYLCLETLLKIDIDEDKHICTVFWVTNAWREFLITLSYMLIHKITNNITRCSFMDTSSKYALKNMPRKIHTGHCFQTFSMNGSLG